MELVGNGFWFDWEVSLMAWLQTHLPAWAISALSFFSNFGEELVLILIIGFLFWCYDKELGKRVGLRTVMVIVWFGMIKNAVLRLRPYMSHEHIRNLRRAVTAADSNGIADQGYSFPSMHAGSTLSLFGSLAGWFKKRWLSLAVTVLLFLIGLSRVAVGVHYPTDVLAGWALGALITLLISRLEKAVRPGMLYGILILTALPGLFFCKSADYFTSLGILAGFAAGMAVEARYVRFRETRRPLAAILRILGGAAIFFALNTALKLPFSKDFLAGSSYAALLVRLARYAVITFVDFGLYPMLFRRVRWMN